MKKTKLLFLIPALFSITACGLGQEVKPERAEEIADNMAKMESPKNMEMKISGTETLNKETYKIDYHFKVNEDKEIYGKMNLTGSNEEDNVKCEVYLVNNEEYGKVAYAKMYDYESKKDLVEVITYKDHMATFDSEIAPLLDQVEDLSDSYYMDAGDLKSTIASYNAQSEADDTISVKYYSKGDNNLSIKVTYTGDKYSTNPTSGSTTITFDKGYLTALDMSMKTERLDTNYEIKLKAAINYPSSLKISLPNDWKNYL